jgi:hypothetical protein
MPSRALNAMLSPIVQRERVWFAETAHCSTYLVCSAVFPRDRKIVIKPATLEQRTPEPVLSFSRVHTIPQEPFRLVVSRMAAVPGPCTDVAGSQRVLQGTRQVASFTRIQLMRAGADLMNTAYNYLDLTPKGRDKVVANNSEVQAQPTNSRIEDGGRSPQTIPGQKSASRKFVAARQRVCQNPRFQPPPAVLKTRCLGHSI